MLLWVLLILLLEWVGQILFNFETVISVVLINLVDLLIFYWIVVDSFLLNRMARLLFCLGFGQDIIFQQMMRLQFQLEKIKIDPVCHIQLVRHAEEFQNKSNIYGQLYGALLEEMVAEVTSVLPLPDGEKTTKE